MSETDEIVVNTWPHLFEGKEDGEISAMLAEDAEWAEECSRADDEYELDRLNRYDRPY
jgi:hypothetical protein